MKTWLPAVMMACFLGFGALGAQQTGAATGGGPLRFELNMGQADPAWAFVARAGGARILLGTTRVKMGTLTIGLADGEDAASLEALEPLPGRTHYLLGAEPERWVRDVPTFAALIRRSVYPGIDVVYRGTASRLELEFVLSPDADARRIALDLGSSHQIAADGGASVSLDGGASAWVLSRPLVNGEPGSLRSSGGVMKIDAPELGREEPRRIRLSIEALRQAQGGAPRTVLALAALAPGLGRDAQGNLRLLGRTDAGLVFVTTLDASGRTVLRTTYLDGFSSDAAVSLAVAASGETAIAGSNGGDAVLVRLDADGRSILSRTVVGGSGEDAALAVALDGSGNAWIAGRTASKDLPISTRSAQGSLGGGTDAFLAGLDPGGKLVYASYLGGGGDDEARAIALDHSGAVYVTGMSGSADFPQLDPLQEMPGGARDAFVARIDPAKGSLGYSTLIGGAGDDEGLALAVTDGGEALIAGTTRSDNFPVVGAEPAAPSAGARVFLMRVDAQGRSLLQSTTLGAPAEGGAIALALDRRGAAWIAGSQGPDAFVARIDPAVHGELPESVPGAALSHLFTGESEETASGLVIDGNGDAWVAGLTLSADLPEVELPESTRGGDVFLARVGGGPAPLGACPGTKNFTGSVSLAWENAGNWSGGTLPGAADDVCVSGFNITITGGSKSVGSLRVENGSLTMNSGTLDIAGASEIDGPLTITSGTLTGAGNVTVSGLFTWAAGTLSGAGSVTANGSVTLSGSAARTLSRTLNTTAAVTMSGTGGILANFVTINSAGTWECQGTGTIGGSGGAVNNTGTFKKTVDAGTTTISVPFTNAGSVLVGTGTLTLNAGSTSSGSFDVAASSILQFSGTTPHALNAGTTFTGGGTLTSTGVVSINTPISLPAGMTFNFSSGIVTGNSTLTTAGTFNWTAGTMQSAGTITCNGPLNISGSGLKTISSRTLNNNGTATWTDAGNIGIGSGGTLNNAGTIDCQNDASINPAGGTAPIFNNTGTFRKSAGTGTTTVAVPLTSSAALVLVQSGTLALSGNNSASGNFDVSAGGTLQLVGPGTTTLNPGVSFTGSGTISSSANININTSGVELPASLTFEMTGGFILGTGTLTVDGPFNWSGGSMSSAGATTCNGPLNVTGLTARTMSQRILSTNGATTYSASGSLSLSNASSIHNTGTWDFQSDASLLAGGGGATSFVNTGTFRRSAGVGTATIAPPFANSGTVDVQSGTLSAASFTQTAGTTKLTGGTFASGANIAIQGGTLAGSGTVSGPVVVSGTGALAPGLSPGSLILGGTYTQQASGAFNVELGGTAGTQYDRANVTGAASLAGALNVSLIGGFVPASGDSFTILNYSSRTGTFALSAPGACLGWQTSYGATALTITARTLPAEVTALTFSGKTSVSWAAAPAYPGTTYDLLRGALSTLPVGPGAGESCLGSGLTISAATDAAVPATGTGFWYVVREKVVGCGTGTYGFATSGAERISTACP